MSESPIDLNKLGQAYAVEIKSIEHDEERTSRLRREEVDAYHHRVRSSALFGVSLLVVVLGGSVCMYAALSSDFTIDQ